MTPFRLRIYRLLAGFISRMVEPKIAATGAIERLSMERPPISIWWHAASAGELEALWPVILAWFEKGGSGGITVFSSSGLPGLEKIRREIADLGSKVSGKLLFLGLSPREGNWEATLKEISPSHFITFKYEAWPDLWASLSRLKIPLSVVGARPRRSLAFVRKACAWLGVEIPALRFFAIEDKDHQPLSALFPGSQVQTTGDPRWDRVWQRSRKGNSRAREIMSRLVSFPRPWGIVGSAWKSDLRVIRTVLKTYPGTIWIVPHKIDKEFIADLEDEIRESGATVWRSSSGPEGLKGQQVPLIDEMGFLTELYASADWAFVGGGFSHGVHSTIEPAIHGIPIFCGSRGSEKFPEIRLLEDQGQLTRIDSASQAEAWMECWGRGADVTCRTRWREHAAAQEGAAARVLSQIIAADPSH